jgi:hypothetical protein
LVLSPTGSINLGFIIREDLLLCSSYLPLGVPNWVPNMHYQAATAEAEQAQAKEATTKETAMEEATASHVAADEVAAGEVAAAKVLSGRAGRGEPPEAAKEAVEDAPAGMGTQGFPEVAAHASPNAASEPGVRASTPMPKEKINEAADVAHAETDAGSGNASQKPPEARVGGAGRSEATAAPEVATKGTLGWKTSTTPTGSSAGS